MNLTEQNLWFRCAEEVLRHLLLRRRGQDRVTLSQVQRATFGASKVVFAVHGRLGDAGVVAWTPELARETLRAVRRLWTDACGVSAWTDDGAAEAGATQALSRERYWDLRPLHTKADAA